MKQTILYFSLFVVGAFWLAYGLGYQQGYQRGGHEERQMWVPTLVQSERPGAEIIWHRKPQYVWSGSPTKIVNAGPEVTVSQSLKPGSRTKSVQ